MLLAALVGACAARFSSAPLGNYPAYQPQATMNRALVTVDLAQPGHVAVLSVIAPVASFEYAPVRFHPIFPLSEFDRTEYEAGRHRLRPRNVSQRAFRECDETEKPTLTGCRRRVLPGTRAVTPDAYRTTGEQHFIVVVANEPIDPYTLADELYITTLVDDELSAALRRREPAAATAALERALRPHVAAGWAGQYVVNY